MLRLYILSTPAHRPGAQTMFVHGWNVLENIRIDRDKEKDINRTAIQKGNKGLGKFPYQEQLCERISM